MEWYNYIAAFFAGAFLCNAVPHFIHGISGDKFPTPFAKPPGKGLSPAPVNFLWAAFNLLIGYVLLRGSHVQFNDPAGMAILFAGVVAMGYMLSTHFTKKDRE
jgi:hypothetical protein